MDTSNLEKAIQFANNLDLVNKVEEKWLEVEIDEDDIANFLIQLTHQNINYSQVYIDRPTLEDYFLQIAKPRKKS